MVPALQVDTSCDVIHRETPVGAANAPQRSDGPAALPYHSPAGAPYVKAQMIMNLKKGGGGGGVFTIFFAPASLKIVLDF